MKQFVISSKLLHKMLSVLELAKGKLPFMIVSGNVFVNFPRGLCENEGSEACQNTSANDKVYTRTASSAEDDVARM